MAKKVNIRFTAGFFNELGLEIVKDFRKEVFIGGKMVTGGNFPSYSPKYRALKDTGNIKRQASQFKSGERPILTADLVKDFKLQGSSPNGFQIGTISHGSKVEGLNRMKRYISTEEQPLTKKNEKKIDIRIGKYMETDMLPKSSVTKFNIGK